MPRHNNPIPDTHSKKDLNKRIKVNFNQSAKKKKRQLARTLKAKRLFPRPINNLKPIIRANSIKHNAHRRLGKGFSLAELKSAGIHKRQARTIGISVDHRRKNRAQGAFRTNVDRLKKYRKGLILFPKHPVKIRKPSEPTPEKTAKKEALKVKKAKKEGEKIKVARLRGIKRKAFKKRPVAPEKVAKRIARRVAEKEAKSAKQVKYADLVKAGQKSGEILPVRDRPPRLYSVRFARIEDRRAFATLRAARVVAKTVGSRKKRAEKKAAEAAKNA